jgi:putative endonuclease
MKDSRQELGLTGEDQALQYLLSKGYILIGRNLRLFWGEIDILMADPRAKNTLVIVEVKTKSSQDFGLAADMITLKKKRKLQQLAKALWQKFPRKNIRIDVVAIDQDQINHIVSAVEE